MNVSLIIPAFNAAPVLEETLDSVAGQTRPPDEVIVVNDGSTDETVAVAEAHRLRPRVISTPNAGAANALNLGIRKAAGDFLCFLDADDLWEPRKNELQLEHLQADSSVDGVLGQSVAFLCPSVPSEAAARLKYVAGVQPGYLLGTMMMRRSWFVDHELLMDPALRTGYFIEWFRQARQRNIRTHMMESLVHRRRIRPGTLSARVANSNGGLGKDFLEIARRALAAKRRDMSG